MIRKIRSSDRSQLAKEEEIKLITTPNWMPINMQGSGQEQNGGGMQNTTSNWRWLYGTGINSWVIAAVLFIRLLLIWFGGFRLFLSSHQHVSLVHRISATVINWVHVVHIRIPQLVPYVLYQWNHNAPPYRPILCPSLGHRRCEQNGRRPTHRKSPTRWNADSNWDGDSARGALLLGKFSSQKSIHPSRLDWNVLLCSDHDTQKHRRLPLKSRAGGNDGGGAFGAWPSAFG